MADPIKLERAYDEHASLLRKFLQRLVRNSPAAEDLTQETLLHYWQRPALFDPERASLRSYLFGVARKKAMEWRRRHPVVSDTPEASATTEANQSIFIIDILHRLPPQFAEILWLREVEGYSYQDLSGILRVPIGTVRSRLHQAREQLRSAWHERRKRI